MWMHPDMFDYREPLWTKSVRNHNSANEYVCAEFYQIVAWYMSVPDVFIIIVFPPKC